MIHPLPQLDTSSCLVLHLRPILHFDDLQESNSRPLLPTLGIDVGATAVQGRNVEESVPLAGVGIHDVDSVLRCEQRLVSNQQTQPLPRQGRLLRRPHPQPHPIAPAGIATNFCWDTGFKARPCRKGAHAACWVLSVLHCPVRP